MSHWPFIIAAYAIGLGGTALLAGWSYLAMRRAEQSADDVRNRR